MMKKSLIVSLFILLWLLGHDLLVMHRFEQNKLYLIHKIEQDIQQHIIEDKGYYERLGKFLIANPEADINTYGKQTLQQVNNNEISGEYLQLAVEAFKRPKFLVLRDDKQLQVHTLSGESLFYSYSVVIKYLKDPEMENAIPSPSCNKSAIHFYCKIDNPNSFDISYELYHQDGILLVSNWILQYI